MNKRIKALWIEALLSNKYTQGIRCLRYIRYKGGETECHCVLGVLADLYNKEQKKDQWSERNFRGNKHWMMHGAGSALSKKIIEWAGLPRGEALQISMRNDEGNSFIYLAGLINRTL